MKKTADRVKTSNPLMKRIPRELKKDIGKYIALFLFLTLMVGFVSGFLVADGSMIKAYNNAYEKYNQEDGHFIVDMKLTDKAIQNIEDEHVTLYPLFYKDKSYDAGKTIRVFRQEDREQVNGYDVMEGRVPEASGEIALDRLFAENNGIAVGDTLQLNGQSLQVVGTVALADYSTMFKNNADMMFDATNFSIALVTDVQYRAFDNSGLTYCYAWMYDNRQLDEDAQIKRAEDLMETVYENAMLGADVSWSAMAWNMIIADAAFGDTEEIKEMSVDTPLQDYVSRRDNMAIWFAGDDMGGDKVMYEWFLYIVTCVLAFAFAITTRNTIEREAKTIGTLRASGYTRRELIVHYVTLPVIVTLASALIGNVLGYTTFKNTVVQLYYHSYSLTHYVTIFSPEALIKTTIIPCLLVIAVELLVVGRSLSLSPLQFLRRDMKRRKQTRAVRLPQVSFSLRFLMRVLIQNWTTYALLFFGIFLASVIFIFGSLFSPLLDHFKEQVVSSEFCQYQYLLKDQVETSHEAAEKYAITTLENDNGEEITIYGIQPDSAYIDMQQIAPEGATLSDGFMEKYGLKEGEQITLKEPFADDTYTFTIGGVYEYPAALAIFMDIGEFRTLFDTDRDYFTGYFTNEKLDDIPQSRIATIITEQDLTVMANQLEDSMGSIFLMFLGFAVVMFVLLIYLLAKLVTERNTYEISMLKILGYSNREAGRLYNSATAVMVVLSLILSGVLGIYLIKVIYYVMMKQYSGWLTFYVDPRGFPMLIVTGIVCYALVHLILMRKIRKIPMTDALKDMD